MDHCVFLPTLLSADLTPRRCALSAPVGRNFVLIYDESAYSMVDDDTYLSGNSSPTVCYHRSVEFIDAPPAHQAYLSCSSRCLLPSDNQRGVGIENHSPS